MLATLLFNQGIAIDLFIAFGNDLINKILMMIQCKYVLNFIFCCYLVVSAQWEKQKKNIHIFAHLKLDYVVFVIVLRGGKSTHIVL